MSNHAPQRDALYTHLCPWLEDPFARLQAAFGVGRLGHAWLLAGPAGLGKINLALAVAARLFSPRSTAPARLAPADAGAAMASRHEPADHPPDLHWVFPEADKRSISVDQIRAMTQALTLTSLHGQAKVVIV